MKKLPSVPYQVHTGNGLMACHRRRGPVSAALLLAKRSYSPLMPEPFRPARFQPAAIRTEMVLRAIIGALIAELCGNRSAASGIYASKKPAPLTRTVLNYRSIDDPDARPRKVGKQWATVTGPKAWRPQR